MTICKRCGACCYLYINGLKIKCKHLVIIKPGLTSCRIYKNKNRVGKVIMTIDGKNYKCFEREKSTYDFLGCPYNTDKIIIDDSNDILKDIEEEINQNE